jgi:hypothetical protein
MRAANGRGGALRTGTAGGNETVPSRRTGTAPPGWTRPGLVYVLGQSVTLLVTFLVAHARHHALGTVLRSWDGVHFLHIAAHGYQRTVSSGTDRSIAFFPGYPALVALVHTVVPSYEASGLIVAGAAGIAASYGIARLVPLVLGGATRPGAPLLTVWLFATCPLSIVLEMTYAEGLFCAVAALALVAMLRERWLTAAALTVVAGLVRETAAALCLALIVAVLVRATRPAAPVARGAVAAVLSPAGLVAYLLYANQRTHRTDAWFRAERDGWGAHFDGGRAFARFAYEGLIHATYLLDVITVVVIVTNLVLLWMLVHQRDASWPVVVYAAAVLFTDITSAGIMSSKVRLLLPAFVLLIPLGQALAGQPVRRRLGVLAALTAAATWYSAYGLILYGYAI